MARTKDEVDDTVMRKDDRRDDAGRFCAQDSGGLSSGGTPARCALQALTRSAQRGGSARLCAASSRSARGGERPLQDQYGGHSVFLSQAVEPRLPVILKKRARAPRKQRLPAVLSDAE